MFYGSGAPVRRHSKKARFGGPGPFLPQKGEAEALCGGACAHAVSGGGGSRKGGSEKGSAFNAGADLLCAASCICGCAKILDRIHFECHGVHLFVFLLAKQFNCSLTTECEIKRYLSNFLLTIAP